MSYDNPNAIVHREHSMGEVGGAATTEYAKFRQFAKGKLKNVHAIVTVAGTSTAHAFDVYVGTSSVATIALGTGAAGVIASAGDLEQAITSMQQVSVKSKADTVGKAAIVYEVTADWDAVVTN